MHKFGGIFEYLYFFHNGLRSLKCDGKNHSIAQIRTIKLYTLIKLFLNLNYPVDRHTDINGDIRADTTLPQYTLQMQK